MPNLDLLVQQALKGPIENLPDLSKRQVKSEIRKQVEETVGLALAHYTGWLVANGRLKEPDDAQRMLDDFCQEAGL